MTATIEVIIGCDGGDECTFDGSYCEGDARSSPAYKQRADYGKGKDCWVYYKGKDYCPECAIRLGITKPSN